MAEPKKKKKQGPKGILGRSWAVLTGIGGATQAAPGLVKDLASAPFTDDEFEGVVGTLFGATKKRGGQALGNLFGPNEGVGAAIGALPGRERIGNTIEGALAGGLGGAGVGALAGGIGAIPGAIAGAVGGAAYGATTNRSAFEDLETAGREGIREPISAAITAASLADAPGGGGPGSFFEHWDEAYKIAQDRSLGQSFALALQTKDITDDNEVAKAVGSDAFKVTSAITDAAARLFLEPDVMLGVGVKAARAGSRLTINSADDINRVAKSEGFEKFIDALDGKSAAEIRHQFFPKDANGAVIADVLAWAGSDGKKIADTAVEAGRVRVYRGEGAPDLSRAMQPGSVNTGLWVSTSRAEADRYVDEGGRLLYADVDPRTLIPAADASTDTAFVLGDPAMRSLLRPIEESADSNSLLVKTAAKALMGDKAARDALLVERPALGARIARLTAERSTLLDYAEDSLFRNEDRLAAVTAELDELYPQAERLARLDAATADAPLREIPGANQGALRAKITRSDFYQSSPFAAPLRTTFNMVPNRWVSLHDPAADVQLARNLQGSTLDLATQDQFRNRLMAAVNPMDRERIFLEAESTAVQKMAADAGMTVEEVNDLVRAASTGRERARQVLQSRAYDGKNRSVVDYVDDDGVAHSINLPAFITQEQNFHTLVDLNEVRRITEKIGTYRSRFPNSPLPKELLEGFYHLWKPAVLLRAGWPIRVVADEQLRLMAKIGVLATMKGTALKGVPEVTDRTASAVARHLPGVKNSARFALDSVNNRALNRYSGFDVMGYEMQGMFGPPGDTANAFRGLNSSSDSFDAVYGADEAGLLGKLRERTGSFGGSINPNMPEYGPAWERAVNLQFGQDPIGKRLLRGESVEDVVRWLNTTPEGQQTAQRFSFRAKKDPTPWVNTLNDIINDYTGGDDVLRQLALSGKAKASDLVERIPDAANRPVVHGEILAQLTSGKGVFKTWADTTIGKLFKGLGQVPTDALSRNPFFDHVYRAEVERLVGLFDSQFPGEIAESQLRQIENAARTYALRESKELLYDLAEESRLSEMLRFVMPFYSAWQEVGTRWAGLAWENPAFAARMRQVWQAPEKAGAVVDERGWEVSTDGRKARDPLSGKWVEKKGESAIIVSLPEWATKNIPGLKNFGEMTFSKKSANLLLQGAPGFGPPVAIAVNEIAKTRPSLEASMEWVLPFGITQDWKEMLLPATAKRAYSLAQGDEDQKYANTRMRIWTTMLVDHNLGKRSKKPTLEEATKATDAFFKLRTFVSWTAPVAMQFSSPYQSYIEAYRAGAERLRDDQFALGVNDDGTPVTADEWFLDTYGDEFFPLTQSLSRSNDGVPPTMEGFLARKKYKDLIEAHPELGGLIIGNDGAGEYSNFVYQNQAASPLRPGSNKKQREFPDFESQSVAPEVRQGWITYGRYMDLIEAERIQRGLPNLNVKAARDLLDAKRQLTAQLEEEFPAWANARTSVNLEGMSNRVKAMREIAADKRLAGRPEIAALNDYFQIRDLVVGELAVRPSTTLTAASNADLADAWDSLVSDLRERELAFSSLWFRWLENDVPEVEK